MHCRQFDDPIIAFGQAVNLLRRVTPFASYSFGRFTNVLKGQIEREHYVFTMEEDRPIGYVGWALCAEDIARGWIEGRLVPSFAQCSTGDCWVGITLYASTTEVCFFQARWCRKRYPGLKVFGIRDYGSRRRSLQLVNSELARIGPTANGSSARSSITGAIV